MPFTGAPFTAVETATRTEGKDVIVATGTVARRSDGSTYWYLRTTRNGVELPGRIYIDDAAKHVSVSIMVNLHEYTSDLWQVPDTGWHPISAEQYLKQSGGVGAKRTIGDDVTEMLGFRQIAGLQTVGSNLVRPIGTLERWYSPELGMNLERKGHQASPVAETEMTISEIHLGEPDPKLFDVPPGYTLVDRKPIVHSSPTPAN